MDTATVVNTIMCASKFSEDAPELMDTDVNPFFLSGEGKSEQAQPLTSRP